MNDLIKLMDLFFGNIIYGNVQLGGNNDDDKDKDKNKNIDLKKNDFKIPIIKTFVLNPQNITKIQIFPESSDDPLMIFAASIPKLVLEWRRTYAIQAAPDTRGDDCDLAISLRRDQSMDEQWAPGRLGERTRCRSGR